MRKSLSFNNIKKSWLYLLGSRSKPPFAPLKRNLLIVHGMTGAHLQSTVIEPIIITQPVGFIIQSDEHALEIKDELAGWLYTNEPVELQFDDEPGRTYFAVVQNTLEDFRKIVNLRRGTIQFLCIDPFGYGQEVTAEFPQEIVSLTNHGTAEADPIFELEVLQPVTFAMIQNQSDEYQMLGRPVNTSEEAVNTRTLILEERGNTLNTWTTNPTVVDGGVVSGQLSTDGAGVTVPNYGSGSEWHGPALIKEVPLTQDFEIDMRVQARTNDPRATFRIEFYLYDEEMNVLGKMAVLDSNKSLHQKRAEGRVGPFVGRGINYLISSQNYSYNWDHFFGMIRLRRIGKRFEFYVTRVANNDQRHTFSLEQIYMDNANEYQGKLKYVQIHIGKYSGTPNAYAPKIYSVEVYSLSEATQDQTPYIAYPGDIITFDHKDDELLINGESRTDLKDFGGSFFKLAKGANQLIVQPGESFKTSVKYRERFR